MIKKSYCQTMTPSHFSWDSTSFFSLDQILLTKCLKLNFRMVSLTNLVKLCWSRSQKTQRSPTIPLWMTLPEFLQTKQTTTTAMKDRLRQLKQIQTPTPKSNFMPVWLYETFSSTMQKLSSTIGTSCSQLSWCDRRQSSLISWRTSNCLLCRMSSKHRHLNSWRHRNRLFSMFCARKIQTQVLRVPFSRFCKFWLSILWFPHKPWTSNNQCQKNINLCLICKMS